MELPIYWKMYQLRSENTCGSCMMAFQHTSSVLYKISLTSVMKMDGKLRVEPPPSPMFTWFASPQFISVLRSFSQRADTLPEHCERFPGWIFERELQSMLRRAQAWTESHAGHFEPFFSALIRKGTAYEPTFTRTCCPVSVGGAHF